MLKWPRVDPARDREAAVRRRFRRIVTMRPEMRLILCRIAGDDVSLHAGNLERIDFPNLRADPAADARLQSADQFSGSSTRWSFPRLWLRLLT